MDPKSFPPNKTSSHPTSTPTSTPTTYRLPNPPKTYSNPPNWLEIHLVKKAYFAQTSTPKTTQPNPTPKTLILKEKTKSPQETLQAMDKNVQALSSLILILSTLLALFLPITCLLLLLLLLK